MKRTIVAWEFSEQDLRVLDAVVAASNARHVQEHTTTRENALYQGLLALADSLGVDWFALLYPEEAARIASDREARRVAKETPCPST